MTNRVYRGQDIDVSFDAALCIHAAVCVKGLPEVFNTSRKPWILPDAAAADQVAAIVQQCPTGALRQGPGELRAGVPAERADRPTTIDARSNRPLIVRGDLVITTDDGPIETPRAALCRCGKTGNSPFCDLSHLKP
ncbi:MAG: (4Fe-4S)-binding protein [Propionibacteriaceae bacterium]|jgi:uncharacterized Fe-S cluster protein YjdI/CDGSH-type Zn-finger protein|nr:(4Fe-4S)-binding protein [Propionibacteriaceae bacterium]